MITEEQRQGLLQFQKDPNFFFRKVLGCDPESYQEAMNQAIADNERVAISACHDVGKSWDLARIVLWFGSCFPYCKIVTTAPTFLQVEQILWSEIRSAHRKSLYPLGGQMNLTKWTIDDEWFALGFTPKNEVSAEAGQGASSTFQGFHASGGILVVFDEATGVPKKIWDMAEGILTQAFVKFVAIGNPTSPASEFAKCFKSPAWHKIKLNCFNSPNLIANGITNITELQNEILKVNAMLDDEAQEHMKSYKIVKPHLLSLKWVVSMGLPSKWGMDHPLFVSKVLGEFPKKVDGALVGLEIVEESFARAHEFAEGEKVFRTLGVDVARFGLDASVMTGLKGKQQELLKKLNKKDTAEVTGEIVASCREVGMYDVIVIDETGVGGGVVDMTLEAQRNGLIDPRTEIRGVQFGGAVECDLDQCDHKTCEKAKYVNVKARMFGLLAQDIKDPNGLALLNEDIYLEELPTILFKYDSRGRMVIESKDDYKKRTGRKSPDHADSLALANYGRHAQVNVGSFYESTKPTKGRINKPFAASLTSERKW